MAHGKIRVNTLTYDTGSGDVDLAVSGIPSASDMAAKAPLASPALTGTPTAPTAGTGTNTTQIATTAFVTAAIDPNTATTDTAQTFVPAQTFTAASVHNGGLTVDGPYKQAVETPASSTIDLSTGNYFSVGVPSNTTFVFFQPTCKWHCWVFHS